MSKGQIKLVGVYVIFTQQLGECIGKGAFGKVYKALNIETGQIVAIKQISISNISEDQANLIQKEISLMKRLSHKNIVKYIGKFYSDVISNDKYLSIVLEYVENGSISGIIKKFSVFQEGLVAFFISQVVLGLKYLHSQGVVHRDIKGANLLTTKEGTVKLADFGVAMRLTESTKSMSIVGTPYWMAPEIVEQTGHCTTSCDIWSLGCTVIELLTGRPPYYDLEPMSALYRIVQDDYPPFPPNISPELKDFLMKCFQKEPLIRQNAKDLLEHPWLVNIPNKTPEIPEEINTQESDEDENHSFVHQSIDEVQSSVDLSYSPQRKSIVALRDLLNNPRKSQKVSEETKRQSTASLYKTENSVNTSELTQLIENVETLQSPRNLYRVLHLLTNESNLIPHAASLLPVLKLVLDTSEEVECLHFALQTTNLICNDIDLQEIAACIGLLSSSLTYIGDEFCQELRIESAFLIGQFFQSSKSSLKLMLASGGTEAIIKLLDPNFSENKQFVILGIDCLLHLLEEGTHYLATWAGHGAIERLALALDNLSRENTNLTCIEKAADLLLTFSTASTSVLIKFCEEDVLSIIISLLSNLPEEIKVQVVTALGNLTSHRDLQNRLENAGFVVDIVNVLKGEKGREMRLACVLALNSICKLSPSRQEQAVLAGCVPSLIDCLKEQGKLRQISISLLCSFVNTSVAARCILHQFNTLTALIHVLIYDHTIFDAIANWIVKEPLKCERIVIDENNLKVCIDVFNDADDGAVQCMLKIMRASGKFVKAIMNRKDFSQGLFEKLNKGRNDAGKAKNCLDLLLVLVSQHPKPRILMDEHNFYPLIVKILHESRDSDLVMVEEIATLLLSIYSAKT